jgi:hypothetical protein
MFAVQKPFYGIIHNVLEIYNQSVRRICYYPQEIHSDNAFTVQQLM